MRTTAVQGRGRFNQRRPGPSRRTASPICTVASDSSAIVGGAVLVISAPGNETIEIGYGPRTVNASRPVAPMATAAAALRNVTAPALQANPA